MPFRFKLDEGFADGVRRVAFNQLSLAAAELGAKGAEPVGVHETRKAIKRLRALLRLVRPALGEETFKADNRRMRDLGRLLSGARDRHVRQNTLQTLASAGPGDAPAAPDDAIAAMGKLLDTMDAQASNGEQIRLSEVIRGLKTAERHFKQLKLEGTGFDLVAGGLEQVYRRGRRDMRLAEEGAGEEAYHDWRKMVQAHWRHMNLLTRAWPKHYEARAALAKELSEVLGDEQDLAVLEATVKGCEPGTLPVKHRRALVKVIEKRRSILRQQALPLGEILYADKPRDFVSAARIHWDSAARARKMKPEPAD